MGLRREALVAAYQGRDLTDIELDVLAMAADGFEIGEIAAERGRSYDTIKTQRRHILVKLNARNMTEAVAIAFRSQLLA